MVISSGQGLRDTVISLINRKSICKVNEKRVPVVEYAPKFE
jgi:hypothetical protein